MSERRSPYLLLGVPFGATKEAAARAFARATRRLKTRPNAPYDLEDLNWALHAVEQRAEDPAISVDDYRMPADPTVYVIPTGVGVLDPPIERYPRATKPTEPKVLDAMTLELVRFVASRLATELATTPLPQIHTFQSTPDGQRKGTK